jgi:hypothetical protein
MVCMVFSIGASAAMSVRRGLAEATGFNYDFSVKVLFCPQHNKDEIRTKRCCTLYRENCSTQSRGMAKLAKLFGFAAYKGRKMCECPCISLAIPAIRRWFVSLSWSCCVAALC